MKIYTIVEKGTAQLFLSRRAAEGHIAAGVSDAPTASRSQIQEHDIPVEVAVCVENGRVESAVATTDISFDVYDCDCQDIDTDEGGGHRTIGSRTREEYEALTESPGYVSVY